MKKEQFLFFVRLLEKWNEEVQTHSEALSDCAFTKNEFIFSWLKSLAVLNQQHMDASLLQLFNWYNSTRVGEPQCFIKKEPSNKSHLEEWEIRNSYKSNLPLEYVLLHAGLTHTNAVCCSILQRRTREAPFLPAPHSTRPLLTTKIVLCATASSRTTF
jgi:hypothetical protein